MAEQVRIDAWVWAVRLYKTRTAAAAAVKAGHVKLNDVAVKPPAQWWWVIASECGSIIGCTT